MSYEFLFVVQSDDRRDLERRSRVSHHYLNWRAHEAELPRKTASADAQSSVEIFCETSVFAT
jgi:hypothetical protein